MNSCSLKFISFCFKISTVVKGWLKAIRYAYLVQIDPKYFKICINKKKYIFFNLSTFFGVLNLQLLITYVCFSIIAGKLSVLCHLRPMSGDFLFSTITSFVCVNGDRVMIMQGGIVKWRSCKTAVERS